MKLTRERVEEWKRTGFAGAYSEAFIELCDLALTALSAEPVAWMYSLVVDGQLVNEQCSHVNWDSEYQPYGRAGISHGGVVIKTPLFTAPPDLLAENARLLSMLGDAVCPHCANSGAVEGAPRAVCCNRPTSSGECCGSPMPEQTQEQCQWCAERAALEGK